MRELHQLWLRRLAAAASIAAFLAWGWLGLKALSGPETHTMAGWRTLAFVAGIVAGTVGWPIKPRKDDEPF
jgi:hypothetical protein